MMQKIDPTLQPLPTIGELKNLAVSDFDQWLRLIVTGGARLPFGSSMTYQSHPLRRFFDKQRVHNKPVYLYSELMSLLAERLGYVVATPGNSSYITVRERLVEVLLMDLHQSLADFCATADSVEAYLWRFIEEAEGMLGLALSDVAWDVAMGAPLYALGPDFAASRLTDIDLPSAYLIGRSLYNEFDGKRARVLPSWVEGHGFRRSDLEALPLFFTSEPRELGAPQLAALRAAYRTHIGYGAPKPQDEPGRAPSGSKLALALLEVQARYYGPNFSLGDQQTWPKQKDVVEWLKTSRGLSEREASSVDIVARPDALRGKP